MSHSPTQPPSNDGTTSTAQATTQTTNTLPFPYHAYLSHPSAHPYQAYPGYGWGHIPQRHLGPSITFGKQKSTQPPETTGIAFAEPLPVDKMLHLLCLREGETVVFTVDVPCDSEVPVLCDRIRKTRNLGPLVDLELWKVNIDLTPYKKKNPLALIKVDEDRDTFISPWTSLSDYWSGEHLPHHRHLHVVVRVSPIGSDFEPIRKRARTEGTDDFDLVGQWMSSRAKQPIPALQDLLGFIQQPLSEDEKIPVTQSFFDELISTRIPDICNVSDVRSLFRIGEPLYHTRIDPIIHAIRRTPFDISGTGTENSYICGWDLNIRNIIEVLEMSGRSNRNSSQHTATRNLRPDYFNIIDDKCILRGEEKGPENLEDPKKELGSKMEWEYDPAPYVFGYYCKGSKMTLCALVRPDSSDQHPVHDLITVNLQLTKDRISNVRHLINLASLLAPLAAMVQSSIPEFLSVTRENCKIEISGKHVVKRYTCRDGEARARALETHYRLLRARLVPNVDQLLHAHGTTVVLAPRGIAREPRSETEFRQCLSCILETLVAIHQIPFYHRDIRWNNIICCIDDPTKWFLIDWEDAASPPTMAQKDFRRSSHSPAVFQDNHTAEVDIWAVGHLITTCNTYVSEIFKLLGSKICTESATLTAHDVLRLLDEC